ncbi:MAG: hypothetical protein IJ464_01555 [Alistipes sp.]|nr:hypothetical protein [Alistipes sp.]
MGSTVSKLDERRSIEIISRMIADTSAHIDRESGKYFLLWGYTTVIVSLFEYVAQVCHLPLPLCLWAWWLIPLVGGVGTLILNRRGTTRPKSYVDRSISAVWMVFGLSFGMAFIAAMVYGANILYLTAMLMGMGTVITGKICQHRVLTIAGKVGMILSLIIPAWHLLMREYGTELRESGIEPIEAILYVEIVIFAAIFTVMMVIPGHVLYNRSKGIKDA